MTAGRWERRVGERHGAPTSSNRRTDTLAGFVLAGMLIPQGMAYAELSGLPAVTGLYTTVAVLVVYAAVGPSPTLVLGPDSSLAPLVAAAVVPLALDGTDPVAAAAALAIAVGLTSIMIGRLRLGTVTELLSTPVRVGYLNGIAAVVAISQLPKLLGFSIDADSTPEELVETIRGVFDGRIVGASLVLGTATLVGVAATRRWAPRVPGVLLAVIATTLVVELAGLADDRVVVTGALPGGFPTPGLPDVGFDTLRDLVPAVLAVTAVSLADTTALSGALAARTRTTVDPNREIVAVGLANVGAGLVGGFPASASSSRTAVNRALGASSRLAGFTAAVLIVPVLLFGGDLVRSLPAATLAAIVLVASATLVDLDLPRRLWRGRRVELALHAVAFAGTVVFGPLEGIGVAAALSLVAFVQRSWRPHDAVLGRIEGRKGYHDRSRHPEAHEIPGLVLFRFDAPLYFANAAHFRRRVDAVLAERPDTQWFVVVAEPVSDLDATAADEILALVDHLDERGIRLAFAGMKGVVRDLAAADGVVERIGADAFFPTVGTAVNAYLDATGVDWTDWTDR